MSNNYISLKVNICSQNTVKTLQFTSTLSVHEICLEIRQRLGESVGGDDHAIFWPAKSKWLAPNKPIMFYELNHGDTIEFKKKHRMLRVRLLDETVKTVLIDDSLPVLLLVQFVCSKFGITNSDEYSLAVEEQVNAMAKPSKKKQNSAENDENVHWMNPEKSLPEQGVDETATLLLKKKFFYSDQSVDRTDPVQLHLIYQQSRDAIITGKHPCTSEECIQFAALQMQIVHGNYDEYKYKVGFLNLRDYLPEEYRTKEIEKRIYMEYKKLLNMHELTCKHRYVQLSRSLKTYGVTYFVVKEKDTKKNKFNTRQVGISKDAIVRCGDSDSKEIIQSWPLTSLRRWAASPTMFTMDFGDYQDAFYSVQTTQGDQMSQLIAGYIDIIMKRKKESDKLIHTGIEEIITSEEIVRPAKAHAIAMQPANVNVAQELNLSHQSQVFHDGQTAVASHIPSRSVPQMAAISSSLIQPVDATVVNSNDTLLNQLASAMSAAQLLTSNMNTALAMPSSNIPPNPQEKIFAQSATLAHLASHLSSCAAVVHATSSSDAAKVAFHATQLSNNLASLNSSSLHGVHTNLQQFVKEIGHLTHQLLKAVHEAHVTPSNVNQEHLLALAQAVTTSTDSFLSALNYPAPTYPPGLQTRMNDLAKSISLGMQDLVSKSKVVAGEMTTKDAQLQLVNHIKIGASLASQLVMASSVLVPLAGTSVCRQGLSKFAQSLQTCIVDLVNTASMHVKPDSDNLSKLRQSAGMVAQALESVTDQAIGKSNPYPNGAQETINQQCDVVRSKCPPVTSALGGDPNSMVTAVRSLTVASTELSQSVNKHASSAGDPARLHDLSKSLSDTLAHLVAAAKESARAPQDASKYDAVKLGIDEIMAVVDSIQHPTVIQDLVGSTHVLGSTSILLATNPTLIKSPVLAPLAKRVLENVHVCTTSTSTISPGTNPRPLVNVAKHLTDAVQALLIAIGQSSTDNPGVNMLAQLCAQDLSNTTPLLEQVSHLAKRMELNALVQTVTQLKTQTLQPLQAQTVTGPLDLNAIKSSCKDLGTTLALLVGNVTQGKAITESAVKVQGAMTSVVQASMKMPESERGLVVNLIDQSLLLLTTVQSGSHNKSSLADAVKSLNTAVVKLLEGATRSNETAKAITAAAPVAVKSVSKETIESTRDEVVSASSAMVLAISQLVTTKSGQADIKRAAGDLEVAFGKLVNVSKMAIPKADPTAKYEILELVQYASTQCVELISTMKQSAQVSGSATESASSVASRGALTNIATSLGQSVNKLLKRCTEVGNLGDFEIIRGLQALEMASARLSSSKLPIGLNNLTYSESLGKVVDDARQVASLMSSSMAVNPEHPDHVDTASISKLCQTVASITDTSLLAASNLSSLPINDLQSMMNDMYLHLNTLQSSTVQQEILNSAADVGVGTNNLCALVKNRASVMHSIDTEGELLVESASTLTATTQQLLQAIKAYAINMNPDTKNAMVNLIGPVKTAIERIFTTSTGVAGPIRDAAHKVVESSRIIALSNDRVRIKQHGAALGHHLTMLVATLRDAAPGQREVVNAIDDLLDTVAGIDEQLLAMAAQDTLIQLDCSNNTATLCQSIIQIVRKWSETSNILEKDPSQPGMIAKTYLALCKDMENPGMLEMVKIIGDDLLSLLDCLKCARPLEVAETVESAEDLITVVQTCHMLQLCTKNVPKPQTSLPADQVPLLQNASKDLVTCLSVCKTPTDLREQPQLALKLKDAFTRICHIARYCRERTGDVNLSDRLQKGMDKLGPAIVGVIIDRSKVSVLSNTIQFMLAAVQESVKVAVQRTSAEQTIFQTLIPIVRGTIASLESGETLTSNPIAPGALQLRCNQLIESASAITSAVNQNADELLGDTSEGSIAILKSLVEEARKQAIIQKTPEILHVVDDILNTWVSLLNKAGHAAITPPAEGAIVSVQELSNKIQELVATLTSNDSHNEFSNLSKNLANALKALPTYNSSAEPNGPNLSSENGQNELSNKSKTPEQWEEERNVNEARTLAQACFELLNAASQCQKEMTTRPIHKQGAAKAKTPESSLPSPKYMDDGTWSDGLVSAAKQVATNMHDLIQTAIPRKGQLPIEATRERLIACTKAVGSATIQVVAAASVKSDINSVSLTKLKSAAKLTVQSAESMANKLKVSNDVEKQMGPELMEIKPSNQTSARLAMLEAQTNVIAMEAELEKARNRLKNIKKARYSGAEQSP